MASAVMGSVGAKVGSLAAGTFGWSAATWSQIGWTAGVLAANYIFAPEGVEYVNEGSRLNDLKITSSTYGMDIPKVYGSYRVSGNIIWSLPLVETRHEETESSGGKGGGGDSTTTITYTYAGTWAMAICEGPISGIRKIWANGNLIYNVGDNASFQTRETSSITSSNFTIYLGTDDQIVDWRMQQDNPDSPAYRHICYILFHDFELEQYSNGIPNITAEVVKSGGTGSAFYTIYESNAIGGMAYGNINGNFQKVWDSDYDYHYTYTNGVNGTTNRAYYHSSSYYNKGDDGLSTYSAGSYGTLGTCSSFWEGTTSQNAILKNDYDNFSAIEKEYLNGHTILYHVMSPRGFGRPLSFRTSVDSYDKDCFTTEQFATGSGSLNTPSFFVSGIDGTCRWEKYQYYSPTNEHYVVMNENYAVYKPDPEYFDIQLSEALVRGKDVYVTTLLEGSKPDTPCVIIPKELQYRQSEYGFGGQDVLISSSDFGTDEVYYIDILDDKIFCFVKAISNDFYIRVYSTLGVFIENIDLSTIIDFATFGEPNLNLSSVRSYCKMEVYTDGIFLLYVKSGVRFNFFYLIGDPLVTSPTFNAELIADLPNASVPINGSYFGGINLSILIANDIAYNRKTNTMKCLRPDSEYIFYFDTISSTSISLADIVEELLIDSGYAIEDYDVTDGLGTQVDGYVITRNMPSRSAIEPLLAAYDYSLVEKDHKLYLKKNQKTSILTIDEDNLGANSENKVEYRIAQELSLTRRLTVSYSNKESDYQQSVQSISRIDASTINEKFIELPLVLTDDQAKKIAEKNLYYNWLIRQSFIFKLPFIYSELNVDDIITIPFDGFIKDVKLTKITTTEDGVLECNAIANSYDIHNSNAIGQDTGINAGEVKEPIDDSVYQVVDIATFDNNYINNSGLYVSSSGVSNSWVGSSIYSKSVVSDDFSIDTIIFGASHIGYSYGGLGDASTHKWDNTNIISVSSDHDLTQTTSTKDIVTKSGINYIIVGSEVIQYVTAIEVENNRYELSTLLRGRRGTEHATDSHIDDREVFVYLDSSKSGFINKSIGSSDYYLAVSIGLELPSNNTGIRKSYEGNNLKPFAPSYFRGARSGNDIELQWMRRSRYISGYFKTLPLVESSELYTIEVYTVSDTTPIRIIEDISTNTYSYDITSDSLSTSDDVKFKVYQISSVVGKGYESEYLLIEGI